MNTENTLTSEELESINWALKNNYHFPKGFKVGYIIRNLRVIKCIYDIIRMTDSYDNVECKCIGFHNTNRMFMQRVDLIYETVKDAEDVIVKSYYNSIKKLNYEYQHYSHLLDICDKG